MATGYTSWGMLCEVGVVDSRKGGFLVAVVVLVPSNGAWAREPGIGINICAVN